MARRKGFVAQLVKLLSNKRPTGKRTQVRALKPARTVKPKTPFVPTQILDRMPDDWPLVFESTDRDKVIAAAIGGLSCSTEETDFLSSVGNQAQSLKALHATDPEHAEEIAWQFFRGEARRVWERCAQQYRDWQQSVRDGSLDGTEKVEWSSSLDDERCEVCRSMEGKKVRLGEPFKLPDGRTIFFPPACGFSHGAGTGCRCCLNLVV